MDRPVYLTDAQLVEAKARSAAKPEQSKANREGKFLTGPGLEWPDPKPIESALPAVTPFNAELLPDALRDYVLYVADRQHRRPTLRP